MNNTAKNQNEHKNASATQKSFLKFIAGVIVLILLGLIFHYSQDKPPIAQKFFEDRKSPESYHEYKDNESAKKKAERNIFLQN